MRFTLILLPCLFVVSLARAQAPAPAQDVAPKSAPLEIRFSTADELKAEFSSVPCKDSARRDAVKALFERAGADPASVTIEKPRGIENVVVRIPGAASDQKIVIGAHYDKVDAGCGAVDNWTGIVTMAHLFRTLKDQKLNKTVIFVAFGQEEKGLLGSSAMAAEIKKEQVAEYCAMINIDSLGLAIPQVADNMSSKKLVDLSAAVAEQMKMPFAHARIEGADSDSSSFVKKKIPALTIHAMNNEWNKVLHTGNDQGAKVNPESVFLGYRLALSLLVRIDQADCREFRDNKDNK
ncbi:MAG TPA: M20/M25/M40 family metallo-hydrolase [Blastocatellia bacterium]|nr:M20/M25/M40 family metallo-hydrolase [Blastocatellia bacterium]